VVARFGLQAGQQLSIEEVERIQNGQVRQECFDAGLRLLQRRQHGRAELGRKLMRKQWGDAVIAAVLDDLQRLGYVDDERFAAGMAASAVGRKRQGPRRTMAELLRTGVAAAVAAGAIEAAYGKTDSSAIALGLAQKQAARLRRLEPAVARRRLIGMLQRRGFDFDDIRPVVERVLGPAADET
jgi:regulatory protein